MPNQLVCVNSYLSPRVKSFLTRIFIITLSRWPKNHVISNWTRCVVNNDAAVEKYCGLESQNLKKKELGMSASVI